EGGRRLAARRRTGQAGRPGHPGRRAEHDGDERQEERLRLLLLRLRLRRAALRRRLRRLRRAVQRLRRLPRLRLQLIRSPPCLVLFRPPWYPCSPPGQGGPLMEWLWLAMGATGSYSFLSLGRQVHRFSHPTPAHSVPFPPKGGCTDVIVNELKHARREVLVLAYSFTSDPIVGALAEAKKRGAKVEIVLD